MLKDFKTFVLRGNVVDLAVARRHRCGVRYGGDGVRQHLLTPLISIPGKHSFENLTFTVDTASSTTGHS